MVDPLIRFVQSVCVQTAVYWGNPQPDGYGGKTYDDPVEISCRWDEKIQVITKQLIGTQGEEVISKAEILLTQDVDENGLLYLGVLDDLDSASEDDPATLENAWRILRFDKTPLFQSATEFIQKAYL